MKLTYKYRGTEYSFSVRYIDDSPLEVIGNCAVYKNCADMLTVDMVKAHFSKIKGLNRRQRKVLSRETFKNYVETIFVNAGQIFIRKDLFDLSKEEILGILLHESGHAYHCLGEEESDKLAISVVGEEIFVSALEKIYLQLALNNVDIAKEYLTRDIQTEYSHRSNYKWNILK